tara:strand:- start:89 stop:328 length:240 start_codon:yes stop_codon:yes gene_type:complete
MLIDMWGLVKAYVNAKERDIVASKFVDIALDNGTSEDDLKELIGMDDELDTAVRDILELEDDSNEEDEYDYGDSDSDDY